MAVDAADLLTPTIANGLPSGWNWKRLDSVCEGVFDCPHSTPLLTDDGPFIARSQDMRSGVFRTAEAGHVSDETYRERIARAEPKYGDLLYSREGTYFGIAAEVPRGIQVCLGQRMVLLRPHASKIDFRFLRYWLNSPVMEMYVHGFRDGTVAERLNLPTIRALPVAVPPLFEQRVIAHVLGTLDDKIELNRRMNETLEAMARAIFKSWFVDFDPVRAKAEARDVGLPEHIADLFPDRFEDSGLGEIPAGWEIGPILKQAKLLSGGTPKTDRKDYWDGALSWASAKDVSQCRETFLITTERSITQKGLDESATQLIPRFCSVVVARGATTGRMVMLGHEMAMNQTCYALASIADTPFALYCHLRHEMDELVHSAHGSVFDTITTTTFANSKVVLPPVSLRKALDQRVTPIFQRILGNIEENQTLSTLRDTLLPKLISGALRVENADKFVEREI